MHVMSLHYGNYDIKNEEKQNNCHNDTAILTEIIVFNSFNSDIIVKTRSWCPGTKSEFFITVF